MSERPAAGPRLPCHRPADLARTWSRHAHERRRGNGVVDKGGRPRDAVRQRPAGGRLHGRAASLGGSMACLCARRGRRLRSPRLPARDGLQVGPRQPVPAARRLQPARDVRLLHLRQQRRRFASVLRAQLLRARVDSRRGRSDLRPAACSAGQGLPAKRGRGRLLVRQRRDCDDRLLVRLCERDGTLRTARPELCPALERRERRHRRQRLRLSRHAGRRHPRRPGHRRRRTRATSSPG